MEQSTRRRLTLCAFAIAILGAGGLSLFGVWLTNKKNATANDANRKDELEKLNREHSFELKRDLLLRVTQSLVQTRSALKNFQNATNYLGYVEANGEEEHSQLRRAEENVPESRSEYYSRQTELEQLTAEASLAVSDDLWKSAQAISASIKEAYRLTEVRSDHPAMSVE